MSLLLDLRTARLRQWVSVQQAATELSVTRQAIHKMIQRGALVGSKLGRIVLVSRESLDAMRSTYRYGGKN